MRPRSMFVLGAMSAAALAGATTLGSLHRGRANVADMTQEQLAALRQSDSAPDFARTAGNSQAKGLSTAVASGAVIGPSVPAGHPRLWYSAQPGSPGAERLARAKSYMATHPVPMDDWRKSTKMMQNALWSVLTGNPGTSSKGCVAAAKWVETFNFPSIDEARWSGENAILIYDWCHDSLSPASRATLIGKWNKRLDKFNKDAWGGLNQPANNYFWGYLRNSLLWGIASYQDNPQAQAFIDHAMNKRYRDPVNQSAPGSAFARWNSTFGAGGAVLEGGQYGPYMLGYPVIAFTAAGDYGSDAWSAVPFWREAVWALQYGAAPAATFKYDGAAPRMELFPLNDDQFFVDGGSAESPEYGDFLGALMLHAPQSAHARQARDWLARIGTKPSWWVKAELATLNVPGSAPALPLDYYASGAKFLYGRRSGDPQATSFLLQLGGVNAYTDLGPQQFTNGGVGHSHNDAGSFQLWRKGRWLSRETTGYGSPDEIKGWNNAGTADPLEGIAHNTLLFEGRGQINGDLLRGLPRVLRLQSSADFAYATVDLTDAYRAKVKQDWQAEEDWPFAERAIREFVYLRALDTLLILDRAKSSSDSLKPIYVPYYEGPRMAAEQVRKSFVLHATGTGANQGGDPFVLGAGTASAKVGDQRLSLVSLLPANPIYRVVKEGGPIGQFRLEYDVSGAAQSYLLNAVSLHDANAPVVAVSILDLGDSWRVDLSQAGTGTASVTFQKGETSVGGIVRTDGGGVVALRNDVQSMWIGEAGPVWQSGTLQGTAKPATARRRH